SETVEGVNIFRVSLTFQRQSKWIYLWQYARFFAASAWFLTRRGWWRKYDLVHVHNMPDVLVFSALFAKIRGAKIILDLHDPMPELMMNIYKLSATSWAVGLLRHLEKWSIWFSDQALTPNISFKNLFVSRHSCRPEKMEVVMNSPLENVFRPSPSPLHQRREAFRIMHHGCILHRHGVDQLVEAVNLVRTRIPEVQLDIYGLHTPFTDSIISLIKELSLEEVVHYHGPKSQAEIVQAIQQTDLGVVPNRHSAFTEINFPTRIFEYLAVRRPVIVPATTGICDYFKRNEIVMFEAGNVDDLASKILWVYENPSAAAEIMARGIQVYQANLWSDQKRRFLQAVVKLI
ncbi:MAG: glycosyltransferase family 4 protein, partial [Lacunisphaera sp.]